MLAAPLPVIVKLAVPTAVILDTIGPLDDKTRLAKVGVDVVAKSCGPDNVIAPAELVTVILLAVPVSVALVNVLPVEFPINNCPSV